MLRRLLMVGVLSFAGWAGQVSAAGVTLEDFLAPDSFDMALLSPLGDHIAVSLPQGDRTGLAVIRLADQQVLAQFKPPKSNHVMDFSWVDNDRLLLGLGEKFGRLEEPQPTGELYSFSVSNNRGDLLVGYRVQQETTGTRIQGKTQEAVAAFVIPGARLEGSDIQVRVFGFTEDPLSRVERMNVRTGRRSIVMRAPVRRAQFLADSQGNIRFAWGATSSNWHQLHYRAAQGGDGWRLLNDQQADGREMVPLGLSADGAQAYLQVSSPSGPDTVVRWDIGSDQWTEVARHAHGDPVRAIFQPGSMVPVGIEVALPKPQMIFFDENTAQARLHRLLERTFKQPIRVTSSNADGSLLLVYVWSDRNPGDYYLVDAQKGSADYLFGRSARIDPEHMATTEVVELSARDGLHLQGYLTRPREATPGPLPMVVLPHGGPYGVYDAWGYQTERQLLAAAGYAVLQVNFRGSGGAGKQHVDMGSQQWGLAMQDDVTDATRWAVEQGIADPRRICIYGASYGAYAALMGAAREPGLYRCAAGYVGVYDLEMMQAESVRFARWAGKWSRDWVGDDPAALRAVSPTRLAGQITVPVFLAAGGEDAIAPVGHTEAMEAALRKAGAPVSSLYYRNEGHGFYLPENQLAYYRQLLAFLSTHLGSAQAAP